MKTRPLTRSGGRLAYALALLLSPLALSAEISAPTVSLAAMAEHAWRRHPEAAGLDARAAAAHAAREMAAALTPQPAAISLGHLDDRQSRNLGRQEWEVELAVPLWLPGQRAAYSAEADSRLTEAAARRVALKLEVAGAVREAWWSLAAARTTKALAVRRLDTARSLSSDVQKRYRVGELSRIDANLAQGEVLAAETQWIEAQAALQQAEQVFRLLTGAEAPAEISNEALAISRNAGRTHSHPLLAAAVAMARSARAKLKLAAETRSAAPELALRVLRERGDFSEPYSNGVGVKLKIPLSSSAQVRRDTSAAKAEADQADAQMRRTQTLVRLEIEGSRRTLEAAEEQLRTAQQRRALSSDNLRLAEKSFALGESDLATLLRIRAAAYDAEGAYDRQRLARAAAISRMNQALGLLP